MFVWLDYSVSLSTQGCAFALVRVYAQKPLG